MQPWIVEAVDPPSADRAISELRALNFPSQRPVTGECYSCASTVEFGLADDAGAINWRETVSCPNCKLIMRWRAALHLFDELIQPSDHDQIYLTEALGPQAAAFRNKFRYLHCSEYIGDDAKPGKRYLRARRVVRHEDVTRLSFLNESLDHILTYDVLEHVPDVAAALQEFLRILVPGGTVSISVPFILGQRNTVTRASVDANGDIQHHLEPQYHGNPLSSEGILCFHEFAWDFLDHLRSAGFASAQGFIFASNRFGYFGPNIMIVARK